MRPWRASCRPRHGDLLCLEGLRPIVFSGHHVELRRAGVHVSTLCPGPVRTAFWENADAAHTPISRIALDAPFVASEGFNALCRNKGPLRAGSAREDDRVRDAPCPARFRGRGRRSTPAPAQEEIGTRTRRLLPPIRRRERLPARNAEGGRSVGPAPAVCLRGSGRFWRMLVRDA